MLNIIILLQLYLGCTKGIPPKKKFIKDFYLDAENVVKAIVRSQVNKVECSRTNANRIHMPINAIVRSDVKKLESSRTNSNSAHLPIFTLQELKIRAF